MFWCVSFFDFGNWLRFFVSETRNDWDYIKGSTLLALRFFGFRILKVRAWFTNFQLGTPRIKPQSLVYQLSVGHPKNIKGQSLVYQLRWAPQEFLPAALPSGLRMIGVLLVLILVVVLEHYFQKNPKRCPILTKLSGINF